jgi:hypothetical protein
VPLEKYNTTPEAGASGVVGIPLLNGFEWNLGSLLQSTFTMSKHTRHFDMFSGSVDPSSTGS